MAYTIYKQTLLYKGGNDIGINLKVGVLLPIDSEILCAREQRGNLCVWYRCNPEVIARSQFMFYLVATGELDCPSTSEATYLDTVIVNDGDLVVHVFYQRVR